MPQGVCVIEDCTRPVRVKDGGSGAHGCINIRHLYLGDQYQNMRDRTEAGVQVGEDHRAAILTESDVREIRRRYWAGTPQHPGNGQALAAEFGVSRFTISSAVHRYSWAWLE